MKLAVLAVLVALAACRASVDDYPLGQGNDPPIGGGSSASGVDASVDALNDGGDGDAGVRISGRVCLLNDLRQVGLTTTCATTGLTALNLTVSLGTRTATPADDGSFVIQAPLGAGFTWHVVGGLNTIVKSAMPFGTDNTIPVVKEVRYFDLLQNNGVELNDLEGSVFVHVVTGTAGVAEVLASTTQTDTPLLYDAANSAEVWGTTQTDVLGVVWVPSVPVQNPVTKAVPITLSKQGVIVATPAAIIEDQTITFLTQTL